MCADGVEAVASVRGVIDVVVQDDQLARLFPSHSARNHRSTRCRKMLLIFCTPKINFIKMEKKPRILKMTIKREFFDAIRSGSKKKEYRDYSPYWKSRLTNMDKTGKMLDMRGYDIVRFRNGYNPNSPVMDVEYIKTERYKLPNAPWFGTDEERYGFAIVLGNVVSVHNLS